MEKKIMERMDEMEKRIVKRIDAVHSFLVALQTGDLRKEDF